VTADRIVEFQRLSMLRQQEHLDEALRRMREAERDAKRHADDLELAHEHNRTLLALLDRSRREMTALRGELLQVRGILSEGPR
jgi:hypothetical protein